MRLCKRKDYARRGAAAVEFALILPVLLLLVLGTIDWGWYFFVREVTVHAAREGARAGTLQTTDALAQSQAQAIAEQFLTGAGLNLGSNPVGTIVSGASVRVTITYPVGSLTGFLGGIMPTNAVGRAEMRRPMP